jgi:hypothetical protein
MLLNTIAKENADIIRDGIAWLLVWKTGRSWHAESVWLNPDTDTFEEEDIDMVNEILEQDMNAVMLNGYYCSCFGEDMPISDISKGIRYHYENHYNLLQGSTAFPGAVAFPRVEVETNQDDEVTEELTVSVKHSVVTTNCFSDIVKAIRSGEHTKLFEVGDIINVGGIGHVIIGMDVEEGFNHSMTIQRHDKIEYRAFAESGYNDYVNSDARKYLNGDYMKNLPEEFVKAIQPVEIDDIKEKDYFFLLKSDDVDIADTKYPYYHSRSNRTKYDEDGFAAPWWFRDPGTGGSCSVRYCYVDGGINYGGGATTTLRGLSPACILA